MAATIAGVVLLSLCGASQSNPGNVLLEQKISDTTGGFMGTMIDGAHFGRSTAFLGDLNGDGVSELAVGAPAELEPSAGTVWILFLNADGTVASHKEITEGASGFAGDLDPGDAFGWSVAALGDLDEDGVLDLAVGANGDDDGGSNRGAVWILFLNADGTIKSEQKISDLTGGFTGGLDDGDDFGGALVSPGDVDGDQIEDLAVGARFDDDGGSNRGALWLLLLNEDGTVKSHQKISSMEGSFSGPLTDGDSFGTSIANLGDIDGSGRTALAVGAPGDTGNEGAVWILFLDIAMDVDSEIKISEGSGGFSGPLDPNDRFGDSLASVDDLDQDNTKELAVGAPFDDEGGMDQGAVWILFMNPAGTVGAFERISDTEGNFPGDLDSEDFFGNGIAATDIDGDGRTDLAVGADHDDDGGSDRGAVWMLFLNDGTLPLSSSTTWNGSTDTSWDENSNWSNGVPDSSKTAIIPANVSQFPEIDSNSTCLHLWIRRGASLVFTGTANVLDIYDGATLLGPIGGVAPHQVRLVAAGMLSGRSTVSVPVHFNADVMIQGGPLTFLNQLIKTGSTDVTVEEGATLIVQQHTTLEGGGTLAGGGTLDLNGITFLEMSSTSPPTLKVFRDLNVDAALFTPGSGCVVFDGFGFSLQRVSDTGSSTGLQFHELQIAPTANVLFLESLHATGDVLCNGDATVLGDAEFDGIFEGSNPGSNMTTSGGGNLDLGGPVICYSGVVTVDGTVFITSSGTVTLDVPNGFGVAVDIAVGSTVTIENTVLNIGGPLTIFSGIVTSTGDLDLTVPSMVIEAAGELAVASNRIGLLADAPVTVRGELSVDGGGELALSANSISVESGGTMHVVGEPGNPARVTGGEGGGYALTLGTGSTAATLEAGRFLFQEMGTDGVRIEGSASFGADPMDLRDGAFDLVALGGVLLNIQPRTSSVLFERLRFNDSAGVGLANPGTTFNMRIAAGGMPVILEDWSGAYAGPQYTDDPGNAGIWGAQLVFFTVRDKSDRNIVRWLTQSEEDVLSFIVERAPQSGGAFAQIPGSPVTANGPTLYRLVDTSITPGTAYFYRLSEELDTMPSTLNELGIVAVDGIPNLLTPVLVPGQPATSGGKEPPVAPKSSLGGAGGSDADFVDVTLPAGLHPPFTWHPEGARDLLVMSAGDAVIDVSEEPVRIAGLGEGASVHVCNLLLDLDGRAGPALIVEESNGLVLLDSICVIGSPEGALLASNATGLVLQDGALPLLLLERGSQAHAIGVSIGSTRVSNDSVLEKLDEPQVRLSLVDANAYEVDAPPGSTWQLFASFDLDYRPVPGAAMPFVLDARRAALLGAYREVDSTGRAQAHLRLPPSLDKLDRPLHLQALVRTPGTRRGVPSTVIMRRAQ